MGRTSEYAKIIRRHVAPVGRRPPKCEAAARKLPSCPPRARKVSIDSWPLALRSNRRCSEIRAASHKAIRSPSATGPRAEGAPPTSVSPRVDRAADATGAACSVNRSSRASLCEAAKRIASSTAANASAHFANVTRYVKQHFLQTKYFTKNSAQPRRRCQAAYSNRGVDNSVAARTAAGRGIAPAALTMC